MPKPSLLPTGARTYVLLGCLLVLLAALPFKQEIRNFASPFVGWIKGRPTIEQRLTQFGASARDRLVPFFKSKNLSYPPSQLTLLVLKHEQILEIWVQDPRGMPVLIKTYPVKAMSGKLGPKLMEGDNQVPEGIYAIESLNPNSAFHVSLRLNYPNEFDRLQARSELRNPGGDIMIHGDAVSIGCVAMGDEAAEELFVLAADTGVPNIKVILSPVDFRKQPDLAMPQPSQAIWVGNLYSIIRDELSMLSPPGNRDVM